MVVTDKQYRAIRTPGSVLVEACPGSGKTRCLATKALYCLQDVAGSTRRIGCITHTNAAVNEIELRLGASGMVDVERSLDIATVHSFCLNQVLRFFAWRLAPFKNGFVVTAPDSDSYQQILDVVCEQHGIDGYSRQNFPLVRRGIDGAPQIPGYNISPESVNEFWTLLARQSMMDFPSLLYHTYTLLTNHPRIADILAARYQWILVDEFQDTTELQVAILREIARRARTSFFLVGDPQQSIYSFAGARPDLVPNFARSIGATKTAELTDNFRSSPPIIAAAERLIPRPERMRATGPAKAYSDEPVVVKTRNIVDCVLNEFLASVQTAGISFGSTAVLSAWWPTLLPIGRALRDRGISARGPGARPYRSTRLFARLAEQLAAYVVQPEPGRVRRIERELFELLASVDRSTPYMVWTYPGRCLVYELIAITNGVRHEATGADQFLDSMATIISDKLVAGGIMPIVGSDMLRGSVSEMINDMTRNGVDPASLSMEELALFAPSASSIRLSTIHGAKGRQFDAVAIVDVIEGRIPHHKAVNHGEIEEFRRLLYVGTTRARRLLMFIVDISDDRNPPSRFLGVDGLDLM